MRGLGNLIRSILTSIEYRSALQTERKPCPAQGGYPLIPPSTLHVAFCVWPICRVTRSTALADMKQSFGARPVRYCLRSMPLIVANHKREGAASVSTADKNCRPMSLTSVDFRARQSGFLSGCSGRSEIRIRAYRRLRLNHFTVPVAIAAQCVGRMAGMARYGEKSPQTHGTVNILINSLLQQRISLLGQLF